MKIEARNIFGGSLEPCSFDPKTGYYRDGFCHTTETDYGTHVVCAIVTEEFLQFSKESGNDLITPIPEYDFPGLKPGDSWCLCALRWKEAHLNNLAPPIKGESTNEKVLKVIDKDVLDSYLIQ